MNVATLETTDWNLLPLLILICLIIYIILKSPFKYPYFIYSFDVSGKKNPQVIDLIDKFLISRNFDIILQHYRNIEEWKITCKKKASDSILKNLREKQFYACLDDDNAFKFNLTRQQTRYRQQNYIKTSYKVTNTVGIFECSYSYLLQRELLLRDLNYECSLNDYHCKKQRSLMTKELRYKIIARDKYTCQYCRKYMPDGVGLHIDHIVPISKGGKTVPSNLQVLCSKCNGRKSSKY